MALLLIVVCLYVNGAIYVESNHFGSYYDVLMKKFSSDGKLSHEQFKTLALDVTANKLPPVFSEGCDSSNDRKCIVTNHTYECLGYDDVFKKFSNGDVMDKESLGNALPSLLYFTQEEGCNGLSEPHSRKHKKPSTAQAWGYGIGFVSFIVLVSNIGALLGPCMNSRLFKRILMFCVALAVGTLAATGLLVLIPESLGVSEEDSPVPDYNWKMTTVLGGIYFVYASERFLKIFLGRNDKKEPKNEDESTVIYVDKERNNSIEDSENQLDDLAKGAEQQPIASVAWVLLVGDAIHNFVDGLSIGAAFTENVFTGISVSLAVVCEELPHELGDIAILLHSGMTIKKALCYNFLAAVTCYAGLIIGIVVGENTNANQWIFGFAGGLFVYIALVAMMPEMNEQAQKSAKERTESPLQVFFVQNFGLIVGFLIIILISNYGKYIEI